MSTDLCRQPYLDRRAAPDDLHITTGGWQTCRVFDCAAAVVRIVTADLPDTARVPRLAEQIRATAGPLDACY